MSHSNEVTLVPNEGWDERILVCRNGDLVDTFIIVTQRYVLLVDTLFNAATARRMLEFARPHLADQRQLLVINSHADYDHAWGNQLFDGPGAEMPSPIIGTRLCAARLRGAERHGHLQALQASEPDIFGEVVLTPPSILFDEALTIDGGDLTLELFATPGHTDDHLSIYIPEIRTLLAADAAEYPFPLASTVEGIPAMRASLARLAALGAGSVLYCHAPVTLGPQLLLDNIRYYDTLEAHCRAALEAGTPVQPEGDADVAALVGLALDEVVDTTRFADFLKPHHRDECHPHAIRMMLEWVADRHTA